MAASALSSRLRRLAVTLGTGAIATALVAGPAAAAVQHPATGSSSAVSSNTVSSSTVPSSTVSPSTVSSSTGSSHAVKPLTAWSITMTASSTRLWGNQTATLTATASPAVSSPYYIVIWQDNTIIARCASGTTCSASASFPTPQVHGFAAAVALYDGSQTQAYYPNTGGFTSCGEQAICIEWHGVSFTMSAGYSTLPINGITTVTATASEDVLPSPFYIDIFDTTTGTLVNTSLCGGGTTCSGTVSQAAATTHKFIAYLANSGSTFPPANVQSTSSPSWVTWAPGGWQLSLSGPSVTTGSAQLTVTGNENLSAGYAIEVFNDDSGSFVGSCTSGSTCTLNANAYQWGHNKFVAFVAPPGTTFPPANAQASSNVIDVTINVPIH